MPLVNRLVVDFVHPFSYCLVICAPVICLFDLLLLHIQYSVQNAGMPNIRQSFIQAASYYAINALSYKNLSSDTLIYMLAIKDL